MSEQEQAVNPIIDFEVWREFYDRSNKRYLRPAWAGSKFEFPRPCGYRDDDTGTEFITTAEEVKAWVEAGEWKDLTPPMPPCVDEGKDGCRGAVEYRFTGNGLSSRALCERHQRERLDNMARIQARYPDSPTSPAWFDESAAGEHWDDDY